MSQRLGEILQAHGSIDALQLHAALAYQRARGRPLGAALADLQFCTGEQVLAALAAQAGLPPIDLDREPLERSLASVLPRMVAEQYRAVPLHRDDQGVLSVAVAAPASQETLETLRVLTGSKRLRPFMASDQDIARAIDRLYPERQTAQEVLRRQPTILIYGWPDEDAQALVAGLAAQQVPGRIIDAEEALAAGQRDILLAPIPAMEALLGGERCRALLIAASKRAEDFPRAEKLAACGFLLAPLDLDCVVRAIQRCDQLLGLSPRAAGAA